MGVERDRESQGDGWDFFDAIYCITLESRPDRMQAAKEQFALVGLAARVEFIVVARDEENPERGIFTSHQLCLRKALTAGARHILIFEDDVFFRKFDHERLRNACQFLEQGRGWDGFALGCLTSSSQPTSQKGMVHIGYRCLTHAYALNRPFAERIVEEPWQGVPIDGLFHALKGDFFALYPMCAFQGQAASDNKTVWIDRMRTLFGGLARIQRGNELYCNNRGLIFLIHLVGAVALIALFIFLRS
ncbi:glycosyltransferase [Desulfobulbus rhabdoformis]|uniref:glycosyltransferase n=1 Tax=Desulfobulbus rhabdoformis TaxID=34032 RepID=UPI0019625368|nr:glycosyltransferase [Desulfobulbus rhabdoformis]MBM9612966.1 glycosyltransferase [Desulfobulbus rhabdoformis]